MSQAMLTELCVKELELCAVQPGETLVVALAG